MSSQQAGDLRTPASSHGEPWGESHDYQVGRSIDLSLPRSVISTHLELTLWQTTCWRPHYCCCTSSPSVMECGVRVILGLSSLYFAKANIEQQARNHRAAAACYVCATSPQQVAARRAEGHSSQPTH